MTSNWGIKVGHDLNHLDGHFIFVFFVIFFLGGVELAGSRDEGWKIPPHFLLAPGGRFCGFLKAFRSLKSVSASVSRSTAVTKIGDRVFGVVICGNST